MKKINILSLIFFVSLLLLVIVDRQANADISNDRDYVIQTGASSYEIYENGVFLIFLFSSNISQDDEVVINYGETDDYGMTKKVIIGSPLSGVEIENLKPNTTYHYKLTVENKNLLGILDYETNVVEKEYKIDQIFTTNGTDLDSISSEATVIDPSSAYIDVQFDSFNQDDTYTLEYTYYKADIIKKDFSVDSNGYFRINLINLNPGTLYSYRFRKGDQYASKDGWLYNFWTEKLDTDVDEDEEVVVDEGENDEAVSSEYNLTGDVDNRASFEELEELLAGWKNKVEDNFGFSYIDDKKCEELFPEVFRSGCTYSFVAFTVNYTKEYNDTFSNYFNYEISKERALEYFDFWIDLNKDDEDVSDLYSFKNVDDYKIYKGFGGDLDFYAIIDNNTIFVNFDTRMVDKNIAFELIQEFIDIINNANTIDGIDKMEGINSYENYIIKNESLYNNLKGKIILKVEDAGKAYYVNPASETMHYLGRPDDAFSVMREQGVGITSVDLEKIPVGLNNLTGPDTDGDGLPDLFEDAIGTKANNPDSDNDGYDDKAELSGNYNPNGSGKLTLDTVFSSNQKGKIFLQVEGNGEASYVNPEDGKRYFLGRPADAFSVMRNLGLGISNENFNSL